MPASDIEDGGSAASVRNRGVAYHVGVTLALALYVLLATRNITLPGIFYDEVLQAPAAIHLIKGQVNANYNRFGSQTIGGRTFALMNLEYIGAFKSYLLAAVFSVFGVNVAAFRLTGIAIVVIGLIFTTRFAKEVFGAGAAMACLWLLATDPIFILSTRTDLGPVALAFTLRMAALFYLWRWWNSGGKTLPLVIAGALLGLGVYDKTNFMWFVVAIVAVGLAAWVVHEERPRLTLMSATLALAAGVIASAPLWIYNAYYNWVTFRMISPPDGDVSLAKLIQLAPARTATLKSLLNGQAFDTWMFGQALTPHLGISGALLFPLSLIALVILLSVGLATRRWRLLFLPALIMAIVAQIYLTPRAWAVWHWIGIYPFPHLAIGVTPVMIWRATGKRLARQKTAAWIGAAAVFITIYFSLMTVINYHKLMKETGGVGFWSDAIYQLADTLKTHYPNRPIQLMDWGMGNTLFLLSAGQLHLREPYWAYTSSSSPKGELLRLVADPNNVFVVNAPSATLFPQARAALNEAARILGATVRVETNLHDRRDRLTYTIIELAPRQ